MPIEDRSIPDHWDEEPGQGPIKSFDGIYRQWFSSRHRLLSLNKGGQVPGHFVKMDGDSVTATAVEKDDKAKFRLHNFTENRNETWYDYYILQNQISGGVVAVNPEDDTITVKHADVIGFRTIKQVKEANLLDVMFIKEQKKALDDDFWFESCIEDGKKRVMGFDQNGMPLKTTEVEPGSKESLLEMKRVWMEEP